MDFESVENESLFQMFFFAHHEKQHVALGLVNKDFQPLCGHGSIQPSIPVSCGCTCRSEDNLTLPEDGTQHSSLGLAL